MTRSLLAAVRFGAQVGALLVAGCRAGPEATPPKPAAAAVPPATAVSPEDPDGLLRALAAGARRIELLPGVHRPAEAVHLSRPTELFGRRRSGGARLYGQLVITSGGVHVHDLQLRSGLALRFADGVRIETATVSAGGQRDAVNLVASRATLDRVNLEAGADSGLFATGSTVTWSRGRSTGGLRSVRLDGGRLSGTELQLEEARLTGLWADRRAEVALSDVAVRMDRSDGIALHVTEGSSVRAERARIASAGSALIAREARVALVDLEVEHRGTLPALGVAGATVTVSGGDLVVGVGAAASVGAHRRQRGRLELFDVRIEQPAGGTSVTVSQATLHARRVRFRGAGATALGAADAEAAVLARGPGATVDVEGLRVEQWPGLAGLFVNDARTRIDTATVTDAAGGFGFENVRSPRSRLEQVRIEGCVSDPGFGFLASAGTVRTATVTDCPAGGLVAGGRSDVTAEQVYVRGGRFGFGAFDGGVITARGGRVRGATLGAVAGCLSRSHVHLDGTDTSTLPLARCR